VDLTPNSATVLVLVDGQTVAKSSNTLRVRETNHADVSYFPRGDVDCDLLEKTDHQTFCPFKGRASYWTLRVGERTLENVVWSYEEPFDDVAGLEDYMAFYADRVEWRSS
jgi:uncharacterized protein (DUF427 family)